MPFTLVVKSVEGQEQTLTLSEAELLIGRRDECTIRAHDDTLGRRHARITFREGRHWIDDLGSDNGTWVNGERVASGGRPLEPNDAIQCGRVHIRFVVSE